MSVQVPKGYKQTEVGVIPEDWHQSTVGAEFEIKNNLRLPLSSSVRKSMAGDFPYYGPTGVQGYINEFRVEGEFALIGEDGDHFLKWNERPMTQMVRGKFNVNNHAHIVLGVKNETQWFYYYFYNRDITSFLTRQGANRYKLTKKTLLDLPCAIPESKKEQQAIADALSDADALIESLEQLIAKKRQIKQGAMQELLTGQRRLPGFSGEWKVNRLGDLTQMCSGGTPSSSIPDFYNGQIPWVSISDMTSAGKYIASTEKKLTNEGFESCAAKMFPSGTVLYAMYASLGECSIANVPLCTSQAILGIQPGEKIDGEYLYYYLQFIKNSVKNMGQQGTQANLNKGMVGDFLLKTPSISEQKSIVEVLHEMDKEISNLELRFSKSQKIKQSMMQELLTGRIRLI